MEALKNPQVAKLRDALVASLIGHAPRSQKCIYLDCELDVTPGGVVVNGDLFAITVPFFGKPKRVDRILNLQEVRILDEMAPLLTQVENQDHAILDLIVTSSGECHSFVGYGPLRRIGVYGSPSKHKSYAYLEPLLAQVD